VKFVGQSPHLEGPRRATATSEDYAAAEAQLKKMQIKFYIAGLFLALTSLMCLFALYSALSR
jgi:hypothetical protein